MNRFTAVTTLAFALAAAGPAFAQSSSQPTGQGARPAQAQQAPAAGAQRPAQGAGAAQTPAGPRLLGQFGAWGAYAGSGPQRLCYVVASPTSSATEPANRPRGAIHLFVSIRPSENVRNEVNFAPGYTFRPAADASIEVGNTRFPLDARAETAWLRNAADEGRLVEAMRRGQEAIVRGVSSRGTRSTDRFALRGLGEALDRITRECR